MAVRRLVSGALLASCALLLFAALRGRLHAEAGFGSVGGGLAGAGAPAPTPGPATTTPRSHRPIPKIIHQTWKSRKLPGWVSSSVESWKRVNPGYEHRMYSDEDIQAMVRDRHPALLPAYEQMKPIQRADLFRYLALLDFGGYYADCDVQCLRPIDEWSRQYHPRDFANVQFIAGFEVVTTKKAVEHHYFAREYQLVQWTMGSAPGHPILRDVIEKIRVYFAAGKHKMFTSIIKSTGPGIWSDAITDHVRDEYGIRFGKPPFERKAMDQRGAHIGEVLILPTRAFGVGGAGTTVGAHDAKDQLVSHGFKGTWKGKQGASKAVRSLDVPWPPSAEHKSRSGQRPSRVGAPLFWGAVASKGCSAGVLCVGIDLQAAHCTREAKLTSVHVLIPSLVGAGAVNVARIGGVAKTKLTKKLVMAWCAETSESGGVAATGTVGSNVGAFRHKTIRFSAAFGARPLVFATPVAVGFPLAEKPIFAVSIRSVTASKFEANVVRLDKASWGFKLQLNYFAAVIDDSHAAGTWAIGSSRAARRRVTVRFKPPLDTPPKKLLLSVRSDSLAKSSATFVANLCTVSAKGFTAIVTRVDKDSGWTSRRVLDYYQVTEN